MTDTEQQLETLQMEFDALKKLADFMADKIQKLTKPQFAVGDKVIVWRMNSAAQIDCAFGDASGHSEIHVIQAVSYRNGSYRYDTNVTGNILEHLIRAI